MLLAVYGHFISGYQYIKFIYNFLPIKKVHV